MTDYTITHTTKYEYGEPVSLAQNVAHLKPRECARQVLRRTAVTVLPVPAVMEDRVDYFGNPATYFTVQEPHRALVVTAKHKVGVEAGRVPELGGSEPWEAVRDRLAADRSPAWLDAYQFTFDSRGAYADAEFQRYALKSFTPGRPVLDAAADLMHRVHSDFVYDPRATTVATPVREVFDTRRGVCQDFAHFQISCLRSVGLPGRYVSGYLSTVPPPGRPRLVGADASHAWLSVFGGEAGWLDLDPTNDAIPGDRHVLVAWGRDYDDVSPVKGVILGGGPHAVTVSVDVRPD